MDLKLNALKARVFVRSEVGIREGHKKEDNGKGFKVNWRVLLYLEDDVREREKHQPGEHGLLLRGEVGRLYQQFGLLHD